MKTGGLFIFSWSHPIHKCVAAEGEEFIFKKNYFDESWYSVPIEGNLFSLTDRKMSTYINALAKAGLFIGGDLSRGNERHSRGPSYR